MCMTTISSASPKTGMFALWVTKTSCRSVFELQDVLDEHLEDEAVIQIILGLGSTTRGTRGGPQRSAAREPSRVALQI